jgi:predicted GTPase
MIRNILIIGRTGTGKSTLGNVLINKNGNFEEMFRENSESVSEINIKQATFEVPISTDDDSEKIRYRIIDTVGIENSRLTPYGVLSKLAEVAEQIKAEGLNHIFLVTEGKFTKEEIKVYDLLSSVIFNRDALKYTTVVRTRFPKFKESEKCQRDRETLRRENPDLAHILNNVNIIYVNNPSLQGEQIEINKKTREASRDNLINHLVCYPGVY